MAALSFDATQVAPSESFDLIPAGKYLAQILQSDMRPTKAGTGQYLYLEHEILDGEFKGRKLFNQLNIINPNQQAVDIANRQLSAICHAVGELAVSDSEQLHFKPLVVVVKVKPADGQYSAKNEIGNYEAASGSAIIGNAPAPRHVAAPAAVARAPVTQVAQAAAARPVPAWHRPRA